MIKSAYKSQHYFRTQCKVNPTGTEAHIILHEALHSEHSIGDLQFSDSFLYTRKSSHLQSLTAIPQTGIQTLRKIVEPILS